MDILTEHAQPSSCPQPPHKKMKHFVLYILLIADQVSGFFEVRRSDLIDLMFLILKIH